MIGGAVEGPKPQHSPTAGEVSHYLPHRHTRLASMGAMDGIEQEPGHGDKMSGGSVSLHIDNEEVQQDRWQQPQ